MDIRRLTTSLLEIGRKDPMQRELANLSTVVEHQPENVQATIEAINNAVSWTDLAALKINSIDAELDLVSLHILKRQPHDQAANQFPVKTSGDGSCLFNSVSILLSGTQELADELRLRTAIYLIQERAVLQVHTAPPIKASPSLQKATKKALSSNGFSSHYTILALANVICREINVLYPLIDDNIHISETMTYNYRPFKKNKSLQNFKIMWTDLTVPSKNNFNAIHFVPIFENSFANFINSGYGLYAEEKFLLLKSTNSNTVKKFIEYEISKKNEYMTDFMKCGKKALKRDPSVLNLKQKKNESCNHFSDWSENDTEIKFMGETHPSKSGTGETRHSESETAEMRPDKSDMSETRQPNESDTGETRHNGESDTETRSGKSSMGDMRPSESESDDDRTASSSDFTVPEATGSVKKSSSAFLSLKEIHAIIKADHPITLNSIPCGNKSDRYLVIDKTKLSTMTDGRSKFHDVLGNCRSSSYIYHVNPVTMKHVIEEDGLYFEKKGSKKGDQLLFSTENQPLKFHQLLTTYAEMPLKRKITQLDGHTRVVVDFSGQCDFSKPTKTRTNPLSIAKIKELSSKKPIEAYNICAKNEETAARNLKSIYNVRQRSRKTQDTSKAKPQEDCLTKIPIVKTVFEDKDNVHPMIILFNDDQIEDMVFNAIHHKSVIGIDRTFNVGEVYATSLVYKNKRVLSGQDHPIMLGPVMLHRESTVNEYSKFLATIKIAIFKSKNAQKCEDIFKRLTFGTDQETALINAIELMFPSSQRLLCSLHLKKNVTQYMIDSGVSLQLRRKVSQMIFEPDLTSKTHEENILLIKETFSGSFKLSKYLSQKYEDYNLSGLYKYGWTNNNCESMNNVIKNEIGWQHQKLVNLIHHISTIVSRHQFDLKSSLHGKGNFKLIDIYKR